MGFVSSANLRRVTFYQANECRPLLGLLTTKSVKIGQMNSKTHRLRQPFESIPITEQRFKGLSQSNFSLTSIISTKTPSSRRCRKKTKTLKNKKSIFVRSTFSTHLTSNGVFFLNGSPPFFLKIQIYGMRIAWTTIGGESTKKRNPRLKTQIQALAQSKRA